jgi:hypothetical protein
MANCNEFLEAMLGAYGARVAFGRQLVEKLEAGDYDLSGLLVLVTGGPRSAPRSSSGSSSCCLR